MILMLHVEINNHLGVVYCIVAARIGMNPLCFEIDVPMGQPGHVPALRVYHNSSKYWYSTIYIKTKY